MKKRVFFVFVLILIIAGAEAVKYECTNKTIIQKEIEEITLGTAKFVNDLGVGVEFSREIPATRKVLAEIMLDAKRISLDSSRTKEDLVFFDKSTSVEFINTSASNATLKVGGASINLEVGDYVETGSFGVKLSKIYLDTQKVDFIIGNKKIYLDNINYPNYKTKFGNNTFLVEIVSASLENAIIEVSKCKNSDIIEIIQNNTLNQTSNFTVQQNLTNNSTQNGTLNNTQGKCLIGNVKNETFCNSNGVYENKRANELSCGQNYECTSNLCHKGKCVKRYFFDSIIEWFKSLF